MNLGKIRKDLEICMDELIEKAKFEEGDIFVLGCSTSEVKGIYYKMYISEELKI